jgi:hypothetical protein
MRNLLTSALFCATLLEAQTVNVAITGVSPTVLADIQTHWLDQASGPVATAVEAIDATSTSITVTLSQATLSAQAALPAAGQTVLLGGEAMSVGTTVGNSCTLLRGTLPGTVPIAHAAGASIFVLRYKSPWEMLATEALRPWMQGVIQQLGARSMTLGGTATGVVTQ